MRPQATNVDQHIEGSFLTIFKKEESLGRVLFSQQVPELGSDSFFINR